MDWRKDGHFDWIRIAVAGWCEPQNVDAMAHAVEHMPVGAVVEIGSFLGRSTCFISRLLERAVPDASFYSVDDWLFEGYKKGGVVSAHITHDNFREYAERQFRANIEYFTGRRPYHFKERSDDFFQAWSDNEVRTDLFGRSVHLGGQIAFAFIDGDHSYDGSKRDLMNAVRFLAPNGFLLIDDSHVNAPHACRRVAEELLEHPNLALVGRFPNIMLQKKRLASAQALPPDSKPSAA